MRVTTGRSEDNIDFPVEGQQGAEAYDGGGRLRGGRFPIMGRSALPSPAATWTWFATECGRQLDRVHLWWPVAFGLGAAVYLAQKAEPSTRSAIAVGIAGLIVGAVAWNVRRSRSANALIGLASLGMLGFAAAKLHSDQVAAPIAPESSGVVFVEGWVVDVASPSDRGERLLIAPVRISGLAPEATPVRIRVVVAAPGGPESAPEPGTPISMLTLLDPPPGPAAPGAYDFARDAWFEGIGGVGLAMRQPTIAALPPPPWRLRLEMAVNAFRWRIACRIARDLHSIFGQDDGGAAGLAVAVTTSHQDWLGKEHRDDLRGSGLAHMLAIAGLHTAALSGFAFFAFRIAIACWPWLALRVPGKKVAAAAALLVVGAYLVLSGAHPPARRAAITASVAFLAILVDRRAVSLHSLAVAAFVILVIEPDVVLQPGFEMSFCATASLVALAEVWRRPASPDAGLAWPLVLLQRARDWLLALCVVSLVAGAATSPFAIQHFNRVANYGVFANLTADFVASAVLMPSLALVLLAQAVGLQASALGPLLWLAGSAAKLILQIGHTFSTAPGAAMSVPSAPVIALAISYVGIIFACLWRGGLRWIGLPMAAAVALWPRPAPPVAWMAADGDDAAVVVNGREAPMKVGARLYATQLWAQRRGFTFVDDPKATPDSPFTCDRKGCLPIGAYRPAISASWTRRTPTPERFAALCREADIVILRSPEAPAEPCGQAIVLTRSDFQRLGSAEVFAAPNGWRLVWSQPLRGRRPWTGVETATGSGE